MKDLGVPRPKAGVHWAGDRDHAARWRTGGDAL